MNFYIGNSVKIIQQNYNAYNVRFDAELCEHIYQKSKNIPFSMQKLFDIDPYNDVVIPKNDLPEIIDICDYILSSDMIKDYEYEEPEEGMEEVRSLKRIAEEALANDCGLVSIGD